jgi:altronate hydrolase
MDINCGPVIDGDKSLDEMGAEIFEELLLIASGKQSKSEALGVGAEEFAPWPIGVTG